MNIAICDDHMIFAQQLYRIIKNYYAKFDITLGAVKLYQNGNDLLHDCLNATHFDIIFLDIEMPQISGIEVAKKIRLTNSDVLIVFVTSFPDYMPASFKVEAFDFLSKPITEDDIFAVLTRCIHKYQQKHGYIQLKTSLGIAAVNINNIVYINSDLHYVTFLLADGEHIRSKMKLEAAEILLTSYSQFIRCHQSYIVNLDYVQEVQRLRIIFNHKKPYLPSFIAISRKYSDIVREKFLLHRLKFRSDSD